MTHELTRAQEAAIWDLASHADVRAGVPPVLAASVTVQIGRVTFSSPEDGEGTFEAWGSASVRADGTVRFRDAARLREHGFPLPEDAEAREADARDRDAALGADL